MMDHTHWIVMEEEKWDGCIDVTDRRTEVSEKERLETYEEREREREVMTMIMMVMTSQLCTGDYGIKQYMMSEDLKNWR